MRSAWFVILFVFGVLEFGSHHNRLNASHLLKIKPDSEMKDQNLRDLEMKPKIQPNEQKIYLSSVEGKKHEKRLSHTYSETMKAPIVMFNSKLRERRADPEPKSEPENPSSEPEGTSENNPNSTSEPKPEPEMWPEPEPDWDTAKDLWQAAWPIHVYGFATILLLLAIISLFELVRIHIKSRRKTAIKISLLTMIIIFCMTRSVALFLDPYGSTAKVNPIVVRLLFSIGQPCVISAMSLLLMVLIDTTKMNIAPPTFQRVQIIIVFVLFHIILVLLTDIVVAYYLHTKVLILICQLYYLIMGFILTIGYARVGYKIAKNSSASVMPDRKMEKLKALIAVASVTGLIMVIVSIYGASGVFGIYSDVIVVEAWPWWAFQTVGRTLEVVMVIVLLLMNINVSGSGHGVREFFSNCKKKVFKNKVKSKEGLHVSSLAFSNSWMTT